MTSNTAKNNDVSNTSAREYSYKGFHNAKNLSFVPNVTIDTSSANSAPLNTHPPYLSAGLHTAPSLDKHANHDLGTQKTQETYASFQNVYRKDANDARQLGVPSYPHIPALSPRTAQGLGLPAYQRTGFPLNSASEPSTPRQCKFDDFKGIPQQKYSPLFFPDSTFTRPALPQQYSCQSRKVKPTLPMTSSGFFKGGSLYNMSEQYASPYSPMVYEPPYGFPGYSGPLEHHPSLFSGAACPYFSPNPRKNKQFPVFQTNTNESSINGHSAIGLHGDSTSLNKEGVPFRQPRGPPPMEELLSPNESENKNFSVRLRRQAINKIVHAGAQRQNTIVSPESTQHSTDDLSKVP